MLHRQTLKYSSIQQILLRSFTYYNKVIIIKIGFIIEPLKNHIIDGNITEACLVRLTREITKKRRYILKGYV